MWTFLIGLCLGASLGILLTAMFAVGAAADRQLEQMIKNRRWGL